MTPRSPDSSTIQEDSRVEGPPGRWLSGNLADFRRDRLAFLSRCARDYGDVVALRFGPHRILMLNHPDAIETVLVTQARNFIKHFGLRMTPLVLGKGLLTSEGDFWLRQRRLVQPAFLRSRIASYAPLMVEAAQRLLAAWTPGETRDILAEMLRLTLDIAAQTLFGADVTGEAAAVREALLTLQESFVARFNSLVPIPWWVPIPRNLRLRRAVRALDAVLYRVIHSRRQEGQTREGQRGDLLSMLLHARDEADQTGMTDRQLRDEAMTLFLAGHETTALTLAWAWYLLARHPQAEARLLEEVNAVLAGRPPTAADLPRLRYTEWVILESLRLYPPAYLVGREALRDCEVAGRRVRAGTTLFMCQWVVHRDGRFFDQPEEFRPERWDNDLAGRLPKYAYFPFGGGPRVCVGNTFALMETVLVLATLAQRFRFTLQPGHQVTPVPTFTLRPLGGIPALLVPRGDYSPRAGETVPPGDVLEA